MSGDFRSTAQVLSNLSSGQWSEAALLSLVGIRGFGNAEFNGNFQGCPQFESGLCQVLFFAPPTCRANFLNCHSAM